MGMTPELLLSIILLSTVVVLVPFAAREWLAKRNERQLETHIAARRGMREAWRRGLVTHKSWRNT